MSEHWIKYYSKGATMIPSLFAKHVVDSLNLKDFTILDIGSGNGRDSLFLSTAVKKVIAIDLNTKPRDTTNCTFIQSDIGDLDGLNLPPIDLVYSRFSMHSIPRKIQDSLLNWCRDNLKPGGHILIEARTINDVLYGIGTQIGPDEFIGKTDHSTPHYRRFLRIKEVCESLKSRGFTIIMSEESTEFAPYGNRKPACLRIHAIRN